MNHDLSELQSFDFVVGSWIAKAFEGMSKVSGPKEYRQFLSRRRSEKVFRFDTEGDPGSFLREYAEKNGREAKVPVVVYSREPGFTNDEILGGIKHKQYIYRDGTEKAYTMSFMPINLTYKMILLARDTASLDKLQVAWYRYISQPGNHRLTVNFTLGSESFPVSIDIVSPNSIMFTGSPMGSEFGKMFYVETDLNIRSQVLSGEVISLGSHIEYIGEWTPEVDVIQFQVCDVSEDLYICLSPHTTETEPGSDPDHWMLFNEYEDCGEWLDEFDFYQGNLVMIPGTGYFLCVTDHESSEENKPGTDGAAGLWLFFCESERLTNPVSIDIVGELVGYIT